MRLMSHLAICLLLVVATFPSISHGADAEGTGSQEHPYDGVSNALAAIITSSDESPELRMSAMTAAVKVHRELSENGRSTVVDAILRVLQSKEEQIDLRMTALNSILEVVQGGLE